MDPIEKLNLRITLLKTLAELITLGYTEDDLFDDFLTVIILFYI